MTGTDEEAEGIWLSEKIAHDETVAEETTTLQVEERTEENLDHLSDMQIGIDLLRLRMDEELEALIPEAQRQKAKAIRAQFKNATAMTEDEITRLRGAIKEDVLGLGYTVRGERLQASWGRGRVSWDTRKLNRYAQSHPEIEALRKVGNPNVSIRKARAR